MGMFDEVICKMPLPISGKVNARFQSKDTPDQYMSMYEIREDGALYTVGNYFVDSAIPNRRINFTGCINFYIVDKVEAMACYLNGDLKWLAEFQDGKWVTK